MSSSSLYLKKSFQKSHHLCLLITFEWSKIKWVTWPCLVEREAEKTRIISWAYFHLETNQRSMFNEEKNGYPIGHYQLLLRD